MNYYLGLDIGGTTIKMGLFKETDELIDKLNFPTRTVEYLVDDIYQNIINLFDNNSINIDFYTLKGVVENLLEYLGYKNRYKFDIDTLTYLHPGISCSIKIDNEIIGYMGKIHPNINKNDIYVFELSIDKLLSKKVREIKYKEISKYPEVFKDVAFIVDDNIKSSQIEEILKKVGGKLLESIDVFDLYKGDNVSDGKKSIAYSLVFKNNDRTLTDDEVTTIFEKMISEVEAKLGAELRNK